MAPKCTFKPITHDGELVPKRGAPSHTKFATRLGHEFARRNLLIEALTHPSASNSEQRLQNYERLEFLGDRVLNLIIANLLYNQFPEESEGDLALRHAALVRRETLAGISDDLGIGEYLDVASGELDTEIRHSPSVLADAMEAVIAAIYLDGGFDAAYNFITRFWQPVLEYQSGPSRDAKTELQEWVQARGLPLPRYVEAARSGPSHKPIFTVELRVSGIKPVYARGGSKRAAEQLAAEQLLRGSGLLEP